MKCLVVLLVGVVGLCSSAVFRHTLEAERRFPHKWMKEDQMSVLYKLRLATKNSAGEHVKDYDDILYVANVQLGTPAQNFRVDMDTGSANFWVPDIGCAVRACRRKNHYVSANSSTYIANGQYFSINYGGGLQAVGFLGTDTLCLGDSNLCITNQTFGQAENVYGRFYDFVPNDGILGLGWPAIAVDHVMPPFQNLMPQLDAPLFNVWLNKIGGTNRTDNGGLITYGALDAVNCGAVTYVPLTSQTFWQFKLQGVTVGSYTNAPSNGWNAISDTGTSFIGGPSAVMDSIAAQIGATFNFTTLLWNVPCNQNMSAPSMVFNINNMQYTIPASNYMEPLLGRHPVQGMCYLQFFKFDGFGFGPAWILGGAFMRSYCQTYQVGNNMIGFSTSTPAMG